MTNDRADTILATADALHGAITMRVVLALFPDVQPVHLRLAMNKLVQRGALAWAWCRDLGGKVWLTTHGVEGRLSGVRRWIPDSDEARLTLRSGRAGGEIKLPKVFTHDQVAGLVVSGLGAFGREYESELRKATGAEIADGVAWVGQDHRLLVEVERMINQGIGRWRKPGGLVEKMRRNFADNSEPAIRTEHVVIAPRTSLSAQASSVAFEQMLAEIVRAEAGRMHGLARDAGWWFLPIDDVEADLTWHPVFVDAAPRSLLGIKSRRSAFESNHRQNAEIDRGRKAIARARRDGVRIPRGVTFEQDTGLAGGAHISVARGVEAGA